MPDLDHLLAVGFTEGHDYQSPLTVIRQRAPDRDRPNHGAGLLAQLRTVAAEAARLAQLRTNAGAVADQGLAVAIEISPAGTIDPGKQLEWKRDGIEVLNVIREGDTEVVTVYVPNGKLSAFEKRIREYLTIDRPRSKSGEIRPAHASLINAIVSFRRAVFDELWTDNDDPPEPDVEAIFQVWLRLGGQRARDVHAAFLDAAARLNIQVEPGFVGFPGRVVVAAHATRAALENAIDLMDVVAEIRRTSATAEFFLSQLRPFEQVQWVRDLVTRTRVIPPAANAPHVVLLDTGVNHGHPLLDQLVDPADLHAVNDLWGVGDHHSHGSEMAGLALYGDLREPLASSQPNTVPHRLESVKILPNIGQNAPHLYGWTADEATRRVESRDADRQRTFAMMTTALGQTAGMPSEWSATIDRLAFGIQGQSDDPLELPANAADAKELRPRLFVLAGGNIPWQDWDQYPSNNDLQTIEDPGQAWNALTVGAYTEQTQFNRETWPDLQPIAGHGALAPSSRTSVTWRRAWPHKPDVVAEGGNGCIDARATPPVVVGPEDLRVLTTSHEPNRVLLAESGDTSAATAEVARICAHLQSRYPRYWEESIRALVANGAGYTPAMRAPLSMVPTQAERETLVGRYGYGRVSLNTSLNSTEKRPTIILQETIVPYVRDGSSNKLGVVNIHALPWPRVDLEALGETSVTLKITLSYFIHPNPSRRGWQSKFRYQSHGLRFAVRAATETTERFQQRINRVKRDEMGVDREDSMPDPDGEGWLLKSRLRSRGSLHSDSWFGMASELANKSEIAVFPVGGWWKEIGTQLGADRAVRYALVVSLEVHTEADVDIYTPIANQIVVPVENP
jgi:hypothetical protein